MSKKPYRKLITIDFLDVSVWVCFSNDVNEQVEWWREKVLKTTRVGDADDNNMACYCYETDRHKKYIVSFTFNADCNVIAHEAYHVVRKVSAYHGLEQDGSTDETGAYLCGWLVEKFTEFKKLANKKP